MALRWKRCDASLFAVGVYFAASQCRLASVNRVRVTRSIMLHVAPLPARRAHALGRLVAAEALRSGGGRGGLPRLALAKAAGAALAAPLAALAGGGRAMAGAAALVAGLATNDDLLRGRAQGPGGAAVGCARAAQQQSTPGCAAAALGLPCRRGAALPAPGPAPGATSGLGRRAPLGGGRALRGRQPDGGWRSGGRRALLGWRGAARGRRPGRGLGGTRGQRRRRRGRWRRRRRGGQQRRGRGLGGARGQERRRRGRQRRRGRGRHIPAAAARCMSEPPPARPQAAQMHRAPRRRLPCRAGPLLSPT
jgi:hypothetical protein